MVLTSRFDQALQYAVLAHAGQMKKSTEVPYISHLLIVAGMALEYGADEDEAIAALLHDAVEDAGGKGRAADIRQRFGSRVADIVINCSDTDVTPKPPAAERKRAYLAHLQFEPDTSVLFVSACDKLANVRSILKDYRAIGSSVFERFNVGKTETLTYYQDLAQTFVRRLKRDPADELQRAVSELTRLVSGDAIS
ncbi:MAG: phosphohydrolase [Acidobacteria bacterium]|nr:MAG: phosphohydrolase [Acidobacteriota bacterium]